MDEIRAYACNELLQLSHGGAEVAGVMFGSQRPGVIRILTWRPIASEYADGETLRLSHRDRMNLAVQLEVARANPELKDLRPVGWFVSHPGGGRSP
jgi:proteasome lid subunit RPN8/RPN11